MSHYKATAIHLLLAGGLLGVNAPAIAGHGGIPRHVSDLEDAVLELETQVVDLETTVAQLEATVADLEALVSSAVNGPAEALAVVRGTVLFDGTVLHGAGFTVTHTGPGTYFVSYTNGPYSAHPSVLVQPVGVTDATAKIDTETAAGFTVHTTSNGLINDRTFKFVAVGPQ